MLDSLLSPDLFIPLSFNDYLIKFELYLNYIEPFLGDFPQIAQKPPPPSYLEIN